MVWAGAMPNAFETFEKDFEASQETLLFNWRSHPELVEIQHVIAISLDGDSQKPSAQGAKSVEGSISAIWVYDNVEDECAGIAKWIANEVRSGVMKPEDCAILVRNFADRFEDEFSQFFVEEGLVLRNVARQVGKIAIQDVLSEDLTLCIMALIKLGTKHRSPDDWHFITERLSAIWGLDLLTEETSDRVQDRLEGFLPQIRSYLSRNLPSNLSCEVTVKMVLDFIGVKELRAATASYGREVDFLRAREGFEQLLMESAANQTGWLKVINRFDGVGQVPLMSVHKSKGLEFHTVIFVGLDDKTWWSFKPEDSEEMRAFFVAFTRAKQRAFFTSCQARGREIGYISALVGKAGVRRVPGPA